MVLPLVPLPLQGHLDSRKEKNQHLFIYDSFDMTGIASKTKNVAKRFSQLISELGSNPGSHEGKQEVGPLRQLIIIFVSSQNYQVRCDRPSNLLFKYFYSIQVQLPLETRDKFIYFTSLTCSMYNFQSKVIQVHFNWDFMGEKCCRHWDSNPRPSELASSGIEHNNHPYWDWTLFLNLRSGFKSHLKGYWLVCYKHT